MQKYISNKKVELRVRLVSTGEYLYYRGQRMYVLVDKDESCRYNEGVIYIGIKASHK